MYILSNSLAEQRAVCGGRVEVCFLTYKLRAHNFSSRSLKQQSRHPPAKSDCGLPKGHKWPIVRPGFVCVYVCVRFLLYDMSYLSSTCGVYKVLGFSMWLNDRRFIPHRGIKWVFGLKKQRHTKGPLTKHCECMCVCVFGQEGVEGAGFWTLWTPLSCDPEPASLYNTLCM